MGSDSINWLGVLLAAFSTFMIGGIWYSALFSKIWQQESGVTDSQLKEGVATRFVGSFFLAFVAALNLEFFLGPEATLVFGLIAGLLVGVGWVATAIGTNYLFEHRSMKLFLINAGYNIVTFALMGLILAWL